MKKLKLGMAITAAAVLLSACGGGGGSSSGDSSNDVVTTGEGQLIDSPVSGLDYVSGDLSGRTGTNGEFEYEIVNGVATDVSFSFGGIEIGSAQGNAFVTPVELAENSQIGDDAVSNIVRFLLSLDEDADSSNGIQISDSVADAADIFSWDQIDFADVSIDTQAALTQFLTDYSSIRSESIALVDEVTASEHLEDSLTCLISGLYFGDFEGSETGPIALGVDPSTLSIAGLAWSRTLSMGIGMPLSDSPVDLSADSGFSLTADNGAVFAGSVTAYNNLEGTWSGQSGTGSFSMEKVGQDLSAEYKYTGTYFATIPSVGEIPVGAFSINIDGSTVTGSLVDIIFFTSVEIPLTGSLEGTNLTISGTNGSSFTGTIDLENLTLTGTWSNTRNALATGAFDANGCVQSN